MKIEWILKFYRDINKEEEHAVFVPFKVTDKKGTSYLVIWRYYKSMYQIGGTILMSKKI